MLVEIFQLAIAIRLFFESIRTGLATRWLRWLRELAGVDSCRLMAAENSSTRAQKS